MFLFHFGLPHHQHDVPDISTVSLHLHSEITSNKAILKFFLINILTLLICFFFSNIMAPFCMFPALKTWKQKYNPIHFFSWNMRPEMIYLL